MSISSIGGLGNIRDLGSANAKNKMLDVQKLIGGKVETQESQQPNTKEMQAAVENLNKVIASSMQSIQFSMDEELGKVVVRVMDSETKQVLRQIPNQDVLAISKNLARLQGLVISDRA